MADAGSHASLKNNTRAGSVLPARVYLLACGNPAYGLLGVFWLPLPLGAAGGAGCRMIAFAVSVRVSLFKPVPRMIIGVWARTSLRAATAGAWSGQALRL